MYEGAVKRLDFMCSSKGWQQTFGLMPKNRAYSLDFPRVRVTYRLLLRLLLRKVHFFGRMFMRKR